MARLPRLYLPGCAQHIIQRGNNRAACFSAYADYTCYLHHLKEAAEYPWSSYQHNAIGKTIHLITSHPVYKALGNTDVKRQAAYRALFKGRLPDAELDNIRAATHKAWILGSDRFKKHFTATTG